MYHALVSILLLWAVVLFAKPNAPVSPSEFKERVKLRLQQDFGTQVELNITNLSSRESVPDNAVISNVHPIPPLGLVSFDWMWTENEVVKKVPATASVRGFAQVAVAKTQIKHQEPLSAQNVKFQKVEVTHHRNTGFYLDWDAVSGLRAMGFITPGTVIGSNNAASPKAVAAGQMVDLIYQKGNLRITGRVKALDGGNLYQWIRVQNPRSMKVFQVKVSGTGEVTTR